MKYTKYRIVKENNNYNIEVPFLFLCWTKLCGYNKNSFYYLPLKFKSFEEALNYAEDHKFQVLKTS